MTSKETINKRNNEEALTVLRKHKNTDLADYVLVLSNKLHLEVTKEEYYANQVGEVVKLSHLRVHI